MQTVSGICTNRFVPTALTRTRTLHVRSREYPSLDEAPLVLSRKVVSLVLLNADAPAQGFDIQLSIFLSHLSLFLLQHFISFLSPLMVSLVFHTLPGNLYTVPLFSYLILLPCVSHSAFVFLFLSLSLRLSSSHTHSSQMLALASYHSLSFSFSLSLSLSVYLHLTHIR